MTNHAHGHHAEKVAAVYLRSLGYKIYALNWRHPRAEIDLVVQAGGGPLTFVEVKYRRTAGQGHGLEYITPAKQQQMAFAARLWTTVHKYAGEYTLAALEVSGADYSVTAFIPSLY